MITYASVFDGIGAVHQAWSPLGWKCKWTSEIAPFPAAVVEQRWGFPNLGDMNLITEKQLNGHGSIDLLVGGTPCQSFSVAGLRGGLDDARGNLALRFMQIAGVLRPSYILWENVPGVLSSLSGQPASAPPDRVGVPGERWVDESEYEETSDFTCILSALAELGYGWAYRILDARYFGVAQRRRRVFVVGCLGDWRRAAAVLFERDCLQGDTAPRRKKEPDIAGTIDGSTDRRRGAGMNPAMLTTAALTANGVGTCGADDNQAQAGHIIVSPPLTSNPYGDHESREGLLVPQAFGGNSPGPIAVETAINAKGGSGRMDFESETFEAHSLRGEGFDASEDGTGRGTPIVPVAFSCKDHGADAGELSPTLRAMGHDGSHANAGGQVAIAYQADDYKAGTFEQCDSSRPLTTSADRTRAAPIVATMAVRRLTPRECERLQGFPDDYTAIQYRGKPAKDGPRYKALGNSMAVPCMEWIGRRIVEANPR